MKRWAGALLIALWQIQAAALTPTWVDLSESKNVVEFLAVGRPGFLKIHGRVPKEKQEEKPLRGKLILEESSIRGEAQFRLDVLDTGISLRNRHMKEKYLKTSKWPDVVLTDFKMKLPSHSEKKEKISAEDLPFEGVLSLHGKKKQVVGTASLTRSTTQLEMESEFKIKITDFGIELPSFMGVTVADEVTVKVSVSSPIHGSKTTDALGE